MPTIVLAEDHQIVRQGLRTLLNQEVDFQVVAETGDGNEALACVAEHAPDVLVVDLTLPGLNGLEVIRRVRRTHPETRVVVLSMHTAEGYIVEALRHGAVGYVLKESGAHDLIRAIREGLQGRRFLSPSLPEDLLDTYQNQPAATIEDRYAQLTPRERQILQLVAEGHTSADIGDLLSISPRTVDTHRSNLMRKLGLSSRSDVVRYVMQRGLSPLSDTDPDDDSAGLDG
ncbi:MAG: response regulator [Bacteroidetes bacterium]|jgi:DNA-binding NarL/FixJ family response regulator|nr:response regulator [Bacteroidota bacterium]